MSEGTRRLEYLPAVSAEVKDDPKERRRLQNRRNQKSRRLRLRGQLPRKRSRHPFEVHRWRLDNSDEDSVRTTGANGHVDGSSEPVEEIDTISTDHNVTKRLPPCSHMIMPGANGAPLSNQVEFMHQLMKFLPPQHKSLPTLIQFNVLMGLMYNKHLIFNLAQYLAPGKTPTQTYKYLIEGSYPGNAVVMPTGKGMPDNLRPTKLQISIPHSVWIDMIPFPRMRDNLIRRHAVFDHGDLLRDCIGDLVDLSNFPQPSRASKSKTLNTPKDQEVKYGETASTERGILIWGEPHLTESWEITPGFLRKWGWTLEGCDDLIRSTNYWRSVQGERRLL